MSEEENSNSESQLTVPYRVTHALIQENILTGTYKLKPKNGRSEVWNVFSRIEDNNGFTIPDKVCCGQCYTILSFNNRTSSRNLSRHKCFKKNKDSETHKTILSKLKAERQTSSPQTETKNDYNKSVSVGNQTTQERNQIRHNILTGTFKLRTKLSRCKVWHVFRFIEDSEGNKIPRKVCCKVCLQVLNFREHTTSNLVKHKCYLRVKNTISFQNKSNKTQDKVDTESSNNLEKITSISDVGENLETKETSNGNEGTNEWLEAASYTELDEFPPTKEWEESYSIQEMSEIPPSSEDVYGDLKAEVGKIFTEWCIENFRPFQLAKDIGLRRFAEFMTWIGANYGKSVDIDYLLPDPTYISESITSQYEEALKELKNEVAEVCKSGYGLTSKVWLDNFCQRSYISLTIHYIKNGQLVSKLLGLSAAHTEEDINNIIELELQETLNNYNCLCEDSIIVTDGSFNLFTAPTKLTHISCINHILENVINAAVKKVDELEKLYNQCLKIQEYFIQSNVDCSLSAIFNSLCQTKWNAFYYLLNAIKENWIEIEEIYHQNDKLLEYDDINELCIEQVLNTLKPFEHVSKQLESKERPTIHLVYACINGLKGSCSAENSNNYSIQQFKKILSEQLQTTVISNLSITHKIALFLFPPANKLIQFSENEKNRIKTKISSLLKPYVQNKCHKVEKEPSTSYESVLTSYLKNFVTPPKNYNSCDQISNEINTYECLSIPFEDNFDILQWWHLRQSQFPLLYKLSCKILATPATCASSEEVFLMVKQLSENNANIHIETLNQLIFLKFNTDKSTKFEECAFEQLYCEKTRIENNVIEEI